MNERLITKKTVPGYGAFSLDAVSILAPSVISDLIRFSEIKGIVIEKGKETLNWMGAFMLGTAILYGAVDFSLTTIDNFISGNGGADSLKSSSFWF
jgi:hypothetical protein